MERKSEPKINISASFNGLTEKVKNADLNTYFIFGAITLILLTGLYAIFSPNARNSRLGNPACGKIVVAADGPSLQANVASSLSGAKYFLIINPLSEKLLESVKNPYFGISTTGNDVAYLIAGKSEEAVIAGNISPQNANILNQFGVKGFGGYTGTVDDVIDLYRQARIAHGSQPMVSQQVAFGFGQESFVCPTCNWRFHSSRYNNNTYPNCPNCGSCMAREMAAKSWNNQNFFNKDNFGLAANQITQQQNPNFWQGPESLGMFVCPKCNWHMYAQADTGEFPRCPNCQAITARSGVLNQSYPIQGMGNQQVALTNTTTSAPPINANAQMPHAYRGVCSNCHQILQNPQSNRGAQNTYSNSPTWNTSQNVGTTQAAWSNTPTGQGTCILR